mgnify:CR=1 FL=1
MGAGRDVRGVTIAGVGMGVDGDLAGVQVATIAQQVLLLDASVHDNIAFPIRRHRRATPDEVKLLLVDPKLLETYDKLGVPLHERARLAGVAVDAGFVPVSLGTPFRAELKNAGVIVESPGTLVKLSEDMLSADLAVSQC